MQSVKNADSVMHPENMTNTKVLVPLQVVGLAEQWIEWFANSIPVRSSRRHGERGYQLTHVQHGHRKQDAYGLKTS